jgi:P4 family phage/plasmid primase-like protien
MSVQLYAIIQKLEDLGCKPQKKGNGFVALCPAHDDHNPSLSIKDGDIGVVLFCFGGCNFDEIIYHSGLPRYAFFYEQKHGSDNVQSLSRSPSSESTQRKQFLTGATHANSTQSTNSKEDRNSKRDYFNLLDYAKFKGFSREIFANAGWSDFDYKLDGKSYTAIKIPTPNGNRYRILDTSASSKFRTDSGYKPCWYLLNEAIEIYNNSGKTRKLIICNGEPSTVIAQHLGLPATCIAAGESQKINQNLLNDLQAIYSDQIVLALDNDETGQVSTLNRLQTLANANYDVQAIQFSSDLHKGYDLADFCKDNKDISTNELYNKLINLPKVNKAELGNKENLSKKADNNVKETNFSIDFTTHRTELYAAYRFIDDHGSLIRYCNEWQSWVHFDGQRYVFDKNGFVHRAAIETLRLLLKEAQELPSQSKEDKAAKQAEIKFCTGLQTNAKINNIIALGSKAPSIGLTPDDFDKDPYMLNCQNGLLNLKTLELIPHSTDNYVMKITNCNYDPDAECPTWLAFLNRILSEDQELIEFIQRAVGYCLTGNTSEKALFFLYGSTGNNGKSTFVEMISYILGDYALAKFPVATLLDDNHNNSNTSNYLAQLFGVRFVGCSELSGTKKLNEETIKDLTGGIDTISARRLYQEPFTFVPTHKIFMFGNDQPTIPYKSKAIWNRLKMVNFNVSIPKSEQDGSLPDKLKAERDGILKWAVDGCQKWLANGLNNPVSMATSLNEYIDSMNILKSFIDEFCIIGEHYQIRTSQLYDAYRDWAIKSKLAISNIQNFTKEMKANNYQQVRKGHMSYSYWLGIDLKSNIETKSIVEQWQIDKP